MTSQQYKIQISGTAPTLYPADTFFGLLYFEADDALEIPKKYPYQGEWGLPVSRYLLDREEYPIPGMIDIVWLSVVERQFYSLTEMLPVKRLEELFNVTNKETGEAVFDYIVVGMAPYGGLALWTHGDKKSTLVSWMQAQKIQVEMKDFIPQNPTITLDENCDFYIHNDPMVENNLIENGLPPRNLFDHYMRQYTYRYQIVFEHWREDENKWVKYGEEDRDVVPEFDYIEEMLYDGTHDKLHDGGLMQYHHAGKPKRLSLKWHVKKSMYTAYFWFDDEAIRASYDRFFGPHPDTKTDLIVRIDVNIRKYELAFYRYGLKEPSRIGESTYELIVFKNGFENFRSNNYKQPRGAWVW